MATVHQRMAPPELAQIHNATLHHEDNTEDDTEDAMDESRDPLEESGCTHDDDSESDLEESVAEDIRNFERTFTDLNKRYRLINRIGEGRLLPLW